LISKRFFAVQRLAVRSGCLVIAAVLKHPFLFLIGKYLYRFGKKIAVAVLLCRGDVPGVYKPLVRHMDGALVYVAAALQTVDYLTQHRFFRLDAREHFHAYG